MMILNCTKKFAKRLPFSVVQNPPLSSNKLGPWCANSFNIGRFPMIILTNERTLLSVVIPIKEVRSFHDRFLSSLEFLLHSITLSSQDIRAELEEMKVIQITQNTNRKSLGSMNDFVHHVRAMLYYDQNLTLEEVGFRLSEIPCAPLKYRYPREAVLEVFDPPPRPEQFKRGS